MKMHHHSVAVVTGGAVLTGLSLLTFGIGALALSLFPGLDAYAATFGLNSPPNTIWRQGEAGGALIGGTCGALAAIGGIYMLLLSVGDLVLGWLSTAKRD